MKAISVVPGTKTVRLVDRPEPSISVPDEIKLRVLRVGICGTDREEAAGGRAKAPPSHEDLVLGHEMFGQVVDIGRAVKLVKPGDYAVFTVRRGCGKCRPCAMNRSDMCQTGLYAERGISGLDGYQTEFVVDHEQYVVRVPPELEAVGVLAEPFSVAEKAIAEAMQLQLIRLPDSSASLGLGVRKALPRRRTGPDRPAGGVVVAPAWCRGLGSGRRGRKHSPPAMVTFDWRPLPRRTSDYAGTLHRPDRVVRPDLRGDRDRQSRIRPHRCVGHQRSVRRDRHTIG